MGVHKRTILTPQQKKAAYLMAIELKTNKEIAAEVGISETTMSKWKHNPLFQEEVDRLLKEEWRDACKELQKIMVAKARKGEFKPLAYVLDSNGYQAPAEVVVEQKTIEVNIEDEPEDISAYLDEDSEKIEEDE